jgi:alpha-glucosidase
MRNKFIYRISLILNVVFIFIFIFLGFKFKDKFFEVFLEKKTAKIVLFGDSNIKLGNWNNLLKRNDIKNSALGGATTSDLEGMIHKKVLFYKPEICFIQGGINDIVMGVSFSRIKSTYKSLIDTLIAHKITPVVQSTFYQENNPQSKIIVDSINNFLIEYCSIHQLYYLDINSKLSTNSGLKAEYSKDGTHITEKAYEVWSQGILLLLEKIERTSSK